MATKTVKKDDVKKEVKVSKTIMDCVATWEKDDFKDSVKSGEFIFRGKMEKVGVKAHYTCDEAKNRVACDEPIKGAYTNIGNVDELKKYTFDYKGFNLQILEVKVGSKCGMYVFKKDNTLVYANITKKALILELAHYTHSTFTQIDNILKTLSGRKDGKRSLPVSQFKAVEETDFSL